MRNAELYERHASSRMSSVRVSNDDWRVLAEMSPGESEAIALFMARCAARIYRLAYGITRSEADAEEIVQEVFAQLVNKTPDAEGNATDIRRIYAITMNATMNKRRSKRQEVRASLADLLPHYTPDGHREGDRAYLLADWSDMPECQLLVGDSRRVLEDAIDRLPDACRAVLVLKDVEELSTEEIAAIVGHTISEVKMHVHRARMAIREHITQRLAELAHPPTVPKAATQ